MARWTYVLAVPLALYTLAPPVVVAQSVTAQTPAAPHAATTHVSKEELRQMVAPIALYPDALLTQILAASTYPLEIVMADRWVRAPGNGTLKGDALIRALDGQDWDASVKSLVPFPDILHTMSENIDWTQKLGEAFLAQQSDVLAAVQALRGRAEAAGTLKSTARQTVTHEGSNYVITPAQPDTVYVPAYDPNVAYGTWPDPSYPPAYYPPPTGTYAASALATGLAFGAGIAITNSLWGWGQPNWGAGNVNINASRFNGINANRYNNFRANGAAVTSGNWQHNPDHRRGVAYANPQVRQQYRPGTGANSAQREAFRGRAAPGTSNIGQNRQAPTRRGNAGTIQRPNAGAGNRPNIRSPAGGGGTAQALRNSPRTGGEGRFSGAGSQNRRASAGAPAFQSIGNGAGARAQAAQGRASRASMSGAGAARGGGMRGGGGGGMRGGGMRGGGGRRGGR
ncbi:DUF3300 domain-containing protein [Nguyenibacter sp. L1]|uniref:DUF3300 domain-containing protein n=1 Tax=Nguyenibacter sp. L1 TaxID=3049350 RepID=UPI002B473CE7|nr:DUF3300 domain-containing protein [Nguyenibacter sp. L1]WRH87007.1 DUF3300 domain-containing protein [Nguyenibacter sp. L1]